MQFTAIYVSTRKCSRYFISIDYSKIIFASYLADLCFYLDLIHSTPHIK